MLSPEPSSTTMPVVSTPSCWSVAVIAAAPASVLPAAPECTPISFSSISAVLLSLVVIISAMTPGSGTEAMLATLVALLGAVPVLTSPAIDTPRSRSRRASSSPAPALGSLATCHSPRCP